MPRLLVLPCQINSCPLPTTQRDSTFTNKSHVSISQMVNILRSKVDTTVLKTIAVKPLLTLRHTSPILSGHGLCTATLSPQEK